MSRAKNTDLAAPFLSPAGAARVTGMSVKWIREGCKAGNVPHIRVGTDYRVNVPRLLDQLNRESMESIR